MKNAVGSIADILSAIISLHSTGCFLRSEEALGSTWSLVLGLLALLGLQAAMSQSLLMILASLYLC